MKKHLQKEILVYAHWSDFTEPVRMGVLSTTLARGKEIFSFTYEKQWLKDEFTQILDPDLNFYQGPQYLNNQKKSNFGLFLDSSPDRWGRVLMKRREAALARKENRPQQTLLESDYLLGVHDEHRMGGLRFKLNSNGNFLDDNEDLASPPISSLRDLEFASLQIEKDDAIEDPEYLKWLQMLISPGSSLGGARPKSGVKDVQNNHWIAKFPSGHDEYDIGVWELVANKIAIQSGVNTPEAQIKKFASRHHTFLTKRFDRTSKGQRLHFSSAMTMLGFTDGDDAEGGVSYLNLVEFINKHGAQPKIDLEELWRRIVLNICIRNTDDHLRNHGFLLTKKGWVLSPVYDLNPIPHSYGLKLNISENDNSLDLDLALGEARHFGLDSLKANKVLLDVTSAAKQWRKIAKQVGAKNSDFEIMAGALGHND